MRTTHDSFAGTFQAKTVTAGPTYRLVPSPHKLRLPVASILSQLNFSAYIVKGWLTSALNQTGVSINTLLWGGGTLGKSFDRDGLTFYGRKY